jgi:hypothetical protein
MQKLAADAAVEADPAGDILDIGADPFAQIGDLVDEGDLGREKGIRRVFHQFGSLDIGEQHRCLAQIERPVELAHNLPGPVVVGADHHPVGAHEVLDCRALAQKFRVRGDVEITTRTNPAQDLGDLAPGADRHRRLGHDDRVAPGSGLGQSPADLRSRGKDIAEVGVPVAAPRRGAYRDEDRIGPFDRRQELGGKGQPPRRRIGRDQRLEPRLVDRHFAAPQPRNFCRIRVDTGDRNSEFGKTRSRNQTHIPRPDHCDAHRIDFPLIVKTAAGRRLLQPAVISSVERVGPYLYFLAHLLPTLLRIAPSVVQPPPAATS